ncbi:MAG: ATP-binding protein [Caldilineaceae bacterium]
MIQQYFQSQNDSAAILPATDLVFFDSESFDPDRESENASSMSPELSYEPWKILIVDDEPEVHQVTKLALQKFTYSERGLHFLSAFSAQQAGRLLQKHSDMAVIFLDVVMEDHQAGLALVRYIREELNNKTVRIILRTGQPGEVPEESIIRRYDINDFRTKTELTRQKLWTTLLLALRTYQQICTVEANQQELCVLYEHLAERNRELQRAKEIAEAASHAKDEFLSVMNHELRTPLNVILMRTEILQNGIYGALTAKQAQSVELIRSSGHHLLAIIDDILDLVRMESEMMSTTVRAVELESLCTESILRVGYWAEKKGIKVEFTVNGEPFKIYSDEFLLAQVLDKLLRNAIKFTAPNSRIGVDLSYDVDRNFVHITVWDTGIGIVKDNVKHLFKPFVQLENSLTRRHDGAGLGLSIAARLLNLLMGTITVESEVGQGSRFTVTLPTNAAENVASSPVKAVLATA